MLHLNITVPEDLKEALDKEMKQGYLAERAVDRELNNEWRTTLADGLDD